MKILNTLKNEETPAAEKLDAVQELVNKVRVKYGNTETDIQPVKVPTTEGMVFLNLLDNEEKVAVATGEIKEVISMATAITENTEGVIFDRVFEGFVAVNPILCNLDQESDSDY